MRRGTAHARPARPRPPPPPSGPASPRALRPATPSCSKGRSAPARARWRGPCCGRCWATRPHRAEPDLHSGADLRLRRSGPVAHFDLWRLDDRQCSTQVLELGWDEARQGVVLVEWPDRLGALRPADALSVTLALCRARPRASATLEGWADRPGFGREPAHHPARPPVPRRARAAGGSARAGADPLAVADGLILLPTRRAARSLTEAFLRAADGRPLLLPRIVALGGLRRGAAGPGRRARPAAGGRRQAQRLAVLARLVMALGGATARPTTADGAWRLARELADLLDEAHRPRATRADKLPEAAEAGYAEHWAQHDRVPDRSSPRPGRPGSRDNGLMDAADARLQLLEVQADQLGGGAAAGPGRDRRDHGRRARRRRADARRRPAAAGSVMLPGLDLDMADDVWTKLDDGHPQAGHARCC